jgi:hypothetical protein
MSFHIQANTKIPISLIEILTKDKQKKEKNNLIFNIV